MAPFTGRAIEEPKTPSAHRVWQLLSILDQAKGGWDLFVNKLASGYSSAWNRQNDVLGDIKDKIQADRDRAMFILSILTAGVGGGLLGGVVAGALRNTAEAATTGLLKSFAKNFATNAASDAASQFGGSATSYFQSHAGNPFKPPGLDPSTYYPLMAGNISLFFETLRESIQGIIEDLESGKSPQGDGEGWYQYYMGIPGVKSFPSAADVNSRDFEGEASLSLWITWGAERDFPYWNTAWSTVQNPRSKYSFSTRDQMQYLVYLNDIKQFDPILDEISNVEPHLVNFVKTNVDAEPHIDLRKLKNVGMFSSIRSAQALSRYFLVPNLPKTAAATKKLLATMNDLPS